MGQDSPLRGEGILEEGPPLADVDGAADGFGAGGYQSLPAGAQLDRQLEVLFAPEDPTVSLELEMIRRVVDGRRADESASTEEGSNPYRIRYATYNLRNQAITTALADAADAGVDVQILLDDAQLSPERTWNVMDDYLVDDRGFEYEPDHRSISRDARRTADLVGITGSGLMHLKIRLFETPEWSAVLSGSMNPGDAAFLNDETLHLIRDPAVVARYAAAYEAVLSDASLDNDWNEDAPVNVLFTPAGSGPRAGTRILEWLEAEDELILLMVYSLRDISAAGVEDSLVEILSRKAREGVPVYVITDRKQSDGVDAFGEHFMRNDGTEDRLRAAGVHVYEATNLSTPYTAMHHKVAVLGLTNVRVITDAANWSFSGLGDARRVARNVESVLFIDTARLDDGRTGLRYLAQWLRTLSRYAHQSAGDGEGSYSAVAETLTSLPRWPALPVTFQVRAHTEWGESIRVRGDRPVLGTWGLEHDGVVLDTDSDSYPVWTSVAPAELPLGVGFEWKLVAQTDGGDVRWEGSGLENRASYATPSVLQGGADLELEATWW